MGASDLPKKQIVPAIPNLFDLFDGVFDAFDSCCVCTNFPCIGSVSTGANPDVGGASRRGSSSSPCVIHLFLFFLSNLMTDGDTSHLPLPPRLSSDSTYYFIDNHIPKLFSQLEATGKRRNALRSFFNWVSKGVL